VIEGRIDTAVVIECFEQFSQQLHKRAYVFLDNSSVQKSRIFIRHMPQWVKRGLIIKYLPPYSPELNLMEILWRFMKYYWVPFAAYYVFARFALSYRRYSATFLERTTALLLK